MRQTGRSPLSFHPTRRAGLFPALFPCSPLGQACSRNNGDTQSSRCQVFGRPWACSAGTRVMEAVAGPRGAGLRVGSRPPTRGGKGEAWTKCDGGTGECAGRRGADTGNDAPRQPSRHGTNHHGGGQETVEPTAGSGAAAPGMCADPLVDDGHAAVPVQLQLLPRGLEPQHLGQQLLQRLVLCNVRGAGDRGSWDTRAPPCLALRAQRPRPGAQTQNPALPPGHTAGLQVHLDPPRT